MSSRRALILDCDGVLADTERDGHLVAFNRMFQRVRAPLHWSDDEYASLVKIGGGKERLARALPLRRARELGVARTEAELASTIARWHRVKTEIYRDLVASGALPPRPGVRRLVGECVEAGWAVAVASTSASESVRSVVEQALGEETASRVCIVAGDEVPRKKPAPDAYRMALEALGASAGCAVAIEDSGIGCRAAVGAGISTLITVSAYTGRDDFTGAAAVLSDLGEPGCPARVLAGAQGLVTRGVVDVSVLEAVVGGRA
jgi:HAD superfamily hydrolase (TIGR01509 family)